MTFKTLYEWMLWLTLAFDIQSMICFFYKGINWLRADFEKCRDDDDDADDNNIMTPSCFIYNLEGKLKFLCVN